MINSLKYQFHFIVIFVRLCWWVGDWSNLLRPDLYLDTSTLKFVCLFELVSNLFLPERLLSGYALTVSIIIFFPLSKRAQLNDLFSLAEGDKDGLLIMSWKILFPNRLLWGPSLWLLQGCVFLELYIFFSARIWVMRILFWRTSWLNLLLKLWVNIVFISKIYIC